MFHYVFDRKFNYANWKSCQCKCSSCKEYSNWTRDDPPTGSSACSVSHSEHSDGDSDNSGLRERSLPGDLVIDFSSQPVSTIDWELCRDILVECARCVSRCLETSSGRNSGQTSSSSSEDGNSS